MTARERYETCDISRVADISGSSRRLRSPLSTAEAEVEEARTARLEAELVARTAELKAAKVERAELAASIGLLQERLEAAEDSLAALAANGQLVESKAPARLSEAVLLERRKSDVFAETVTALLEATQDAWWLQTVVGAWKNVVCAQALERICSASFAHEGNS
eukprot:TRINITY_DN121600_c0_g1_i1.p1 TRINITY_DN121600_c0_g1~~TRINITY_DN121600_c0_g1_i1.p1  ORF type:complete len:163 (-),score=47.08 TRINITY_DN121600_c0_g1_i1:104-592(-)